MIHIDYTEPRDDPIWKRWRRSCEAETGRLCKKVNDGQFPKMTDLYECKGKVFFSVDGPFKGKCAYCETYLKQLQNPDVEHFRPKLAVTDEKGIPILTDYGSGPVLHKGYYWLAYDWRNLMPCCAKCNQASNINGEKIGKHNRFHVDGVHARSEEEMLAERPLLLNPISTIRLTILPFILR